MLHICLSLFNGQHLKSHASQVIVNITSIANIIILDILYFNWVQTTLEFLFLT